MILKARSVRIEKGPVKARHVFHHLSARIFENFVYAAGSGWRRNIERMYQIIP